jgi:hypothetical protein
MSARTTTRNVLSPVLSGGLRATAVLAAATAVASEANAEIAFANYIDESTFAFIVQDMPDFDQVRSVLPNTGNCYCGPASTTDLLGYVATHGYGDVEPGVPLVSWFGSGSYNEISSLLADIGASTGTSSGAGGTSCGVGQEALYDELVERIGDRFTVRNCLWNRSTGYAPDTEEVAFRGWRDQAVGLMLYGRWAGSFTGERWDSNTRRGGHFEAVNRAIGGGGIIKLGLRNPVSGDSTSAQSAFATEWFDVTRRSVRISGDTLTVDQLNDVYPSGTETRMRIFEGYLSISPKAGYTWDEVTESIIRFTPGAGAWSALATERETIPTPGRPSCVEFGPSDLAFASIIDGKVVKTSRDARLDDPHEGISIKIPGWNGATDLEFDDQRRLHVLGGDRVVTIDWDSGETLYDVRLPGEGTSMAVENGIVHVLVPEMELVAAINEGPGHMIVELPLPEDAFVAADSSITMLPGGRLFLLSEGKVNPMQITDAGFQRLWMPVPRDGDWKSIVIDDRSTLCMVDQEGLVEAYKVGPNGFERDEKHPMDGATAGAGLAVARSTSNWTPETQAWVGSDDTFDDRAVELDCLGDLNFDGKVDSADIGMLLGDWGATRSIADLNHDGTVDSADIGLLLGAFGVCP